jgi:translation elongation factor EF-Tu-like GTPase
MTTNLEVRVKFLSFEDGGRKQLPFLRDYRPHFVVPTRKELLGVMFTHGPEVYEPNEEVLARLKFSLTGLGLVSCAT